MTQENFTYFLDKFGEIGYVSQVSSSIVIVEGLPGVHANEVVIFETGERGQVFSLFRSGISVLLFSKQIPSPGTRVARTGESLKVPVGEYLIGNIISPFGEILANDKNKKIQPAAEYRTIDETPLNISSRKEISKPFDTGVSIVDMLIPLGKGQRELIIGDRKTGKSTFLLQAMYNQVLQGTLCIYAAIGKQHSDIQTIENFCRQKKILDNIILLLSFRHDPEGSIYVAPFAAMTIAEYFRDRGKHVLLILDDLTTHAKSYRTISLTAKRYPGRNSYPPNIFHTHAKLLERAGNFILNDKEVSITCLPVAETTRGDLSGYIQTNLMSMTDGHIFFDVNIFESGRRPAINSTLSVSRVGRQTQSRLRGSIARETTSFISLMDQVEKYSHFGQEASTTVRQTLATGKQLMVLLEQQTEQVISLQLQLFLFALLWMGKWDKITVDQQRIRINLIIQTYANNPNLRYLISGLVENSGDLNTFLEVIRQHEAEIDTFLSQVENKTDIEQKNKNYVVQ